LKLRMISFGKRGRKKGGGLEACDRVCHWAVSDWEWGKSN